MSERIHLLCDLCGEEFAVSVEAYRARSGMVECPLCGCLDLVLLEDGNHMTPAA